MSGFHIGLGVLAVVLGICQGQNNGGLYGAVQSMTLSLCKNLYMAGQLSAYLSLCNGLS